MKFRFKYSKDTIFFDIFCFESKAIFCVFCFVLSFRDFSVFFCIVENLPLFVRAGSDLVSVLL